MRSRILMLSAALLISGSCVRAADLPKPKASPGHVMLPQEHQYQRVLRKYMATLSEKDFDHGVTAKLSVAPLDADPEHQYRMFLMTQMLQPLVGWKRGTPAVNAPSWLFLLSTIEGPKTGPSRAEAIGNFVQQPKHTIRRGPIPTPTGIVVPPVWPETLVAFTQWKYPGYPFYDNRALKMRAFVTAAVRLIMLDNHFGDMQKPGRSDWNGYKLVTFSITYMGVKDLLPAEVRTAYKEGLQRLGRRILRWGIKGEEPNLDMTVPIGLWYVTQACGDADFAKEAEAYARRLMSDPHHFHPAGYWVERGGGLDTGFGGMANFFAVWTALATDWDFARKTVERAYHLRAHLSLPEPDGTRNGPSQFNSRIGTPACDDQWEWGIRNLAASIITDEAACSITAPTKEQMKGAAAKQVTHFNSQIHGGFRNPYNSFGNRYGYVRDEDIRGHTWKWRMWDTYNFPVTVNPAYEFYRKGAYAHLCKLKRENSPMLKSPYLRGEIFCRSFENVFIATRQDAYAAILHTGPVGLQDPNDGMVQFKGPMGFGGGQLSAFWSPATGSVLLGRRVGMSSGKNFDALELWRQWPIHAVSGVTRDAKVFTSARTLQPDVVSDLKGNTGTVSVSGVLPAGLFGQGKALNGQIAYTRTFCIEPGKLSVETTVSADGKDSIAELYETLPVFLRDVRKTPKTAPTVIEFQTGREWAPATDKYQEKVTAVRLKRFSGAVQITFDRPRRVKLSDADWVDTYLSRASCRNILIDLLESGDRPVALKNAKKVVYRIEPTVGRGDR